MNADMGESFGPWVMGNDEALLEVITSANVACGFHGGDPDVMARTIAAAAARGVSVGAHPGLPDLQGFGRRRMVISPGEVAHLVQYQLGAIRGMAQAAGVPVGHLKLHGALANMAAGDELLARAAYEAALEIDPDLTIFVIAGTAQQRAMEEVGGAWAGEIFADRAYNADATLVDRRQPNAMVHDPAIAATRMVDFVTRGVIVPVEGAPFPVQIDTICLHGDGPEALAIARATRDALAGSGITLSAPWGPSERAARAS
ncbi:MAG: 5-oxoprolinase subunit PxpA [Pseudomonadota bacterium]